jgi:hypothetical protein
MSKFSIKQSGDTGAPRIQETGGHKGFYATIFHNDFPFARVYGQTISETLHNVERIAELLNQYGL